MTRPSLDEVRAQYPGAETFRFADGDREPGERLLTLVRSSAKRATCQAKSVYDAGEEPWPKVGRRDIALNCDGTPALVIETTSLEERAFMDVPEDFALVEGEEPPKASRESHHFGIGRNRKTPNWIVGSVKFGSKMSDATHRGTGNAKIPIGTSRAAHGIMQGLVPLQPNMS